MSIINKMHQELEAHRDDSPILSSMPEKKQKKRVLLFGLISLLLLFSIVLSYLIYEKEHAGNDALASPIVKVEPVVSAQPTQQKAVAVAVMPSTLAEPIAPNNHTADNSSPVKAAPKVEMNTHTEALTSSKPLPEIPDSLPEAPASNHIEVVKKADTVKKELHRAPPQQEEVAHLEIKKSVLSAAQLAAIHLKNAQKALLQGDSALAAQLKIKALNQQPQLHDVRQSLALYYYGINEQKMAKSLLQKGALQFPEHADFNLMLARIALKNSEPENAYFYLRQAPPEVAGNMDYHVSYAILAQKFQQYEQAEQLYKGLLTQRPNNGRWLMSLAIAQDKQDKESLAVQSYQKALLQVDLSSNAKKYINQRLTYLANQ